MRKVALLGALIAALVSAAVAVAAVTNTYTVTATVTPSKAGTKAKPVPVAIGFNYTVGEASGQRPGVVTQYSIGFGGIKTNGGLFPTCTADQINNATPSGDQNCPAGAVVGTGNVENISGSTSNPSDQSIKCHLDLKVYNSGAGKAALFLSGDPAAPKPCVIHISQAIPATYAAGPDGGSSLVFSVPATLAHPLPGFDNAVVQVASNIKLLTKRVHGKKLGYFQSVGGCKNKKRTISVTFTTEAGQTTTTGTTVRCKK